jgi:hypothetical protein
MTRLIAQLTHYVRGLIADANLASVTQPARPIGLSAASLRTLDHPTYLRRGVIIAGLASGNRPRGL